MRGRAFKIVRVAALFLLVGAILNVAVAWGSAMWIRDRGRLRAATVAFSKKVYREDATLMGWTVEICQLPGVSSATSSYSDDTQWVKQYMRMPYETVGAPQDILPGWASDLHPPSVRDMRDITLSQPTKVKIVLGRGWPMISCTCLFEGLNLPPYYVASKAIDLGFVAASPPRAIYDTWPRLLPLRPYVFGFVIDSLFYAVITFMPLRGPVLLRRMLRRRRGSCVACGYDLRHMPHGTCPECGAATV